ncbi:MAG: hypothetical protein EOO92_28465, partial [Pedobacter sp.]
SNGTNLRLLNDNNTHQTDPRWSPDSQKIAFITSVILPEYNAENRQVVIVDKDGKNLIDFSGGIKPTLNDSPQWSPDSRKITFTSARDGDFEIFIDPDNDARDYFEIEVNQRNKIFDLFLPQPYRDKGDALISWDAPGMQSAVQLQGTLNNPTDIDKGWTVEFKIPFNTIKMGFANGTPAEGALWRINFSRVEWDTRVKNGKYIKLTNAKGKKLPERNWVWSAPGIISMHAPERWGYLQFTKKEHETFPVFKVPYADLQKQYLWLIYYNQQQYYRQHGVYTSSLNDLGISSPGIDIAGTPNVISISSSMYHYSASVGDGKAMVWTISNEGLIRPNQLSAKPK